MTRRLRRPAATPGPGAEEAPTAATGGGPARLTPRQEEGAMPERAFWDYDQFPYMLHSPLRHVEQRRDGPVAHVHGYGGSVFSHFAILPEPKGEQLAFALQQMERSYGRELRELRQRHLAELEAILNVYKVEHPRAHVLFKKETMS